MKMRLKVINKALLCGAAIAAILWGASSSKAQDTGYYAQQTYTASGSNSTFAIPFGYLSQSDIYVYINGVLYSGTVTFPTTGTLQLSTTPAAGATVVIKRSTSLSSPKATFTGGPLAAADLNANALQDLYGLQEKDDQLTSGVQGQVFAGPGLSGGGPIGSNPTIALGNNLSSLNQVSYQGVSLVPVLQGYGTWASVGIGSFGASLLGQATQASAQSALGLGSAALVNTTAFDASGSAAAALSSAEAYSSNATNLTSGTIPSGRLSGPYAGITQIGNQTAFFSLYGDATSALQPVTYEQLQSVAAGVSGNQYAVKAAPTSNVTLSNPGTATFDTYTASVGDLLLLLNQTNTPDNGIYQFNGSSSALTRASNANTYASLYGSGVFITQGSTYRATSFKAQIPTTGTLGTTPIVYAQSGAATSYSASTGLNLSGTVFSLANTSVASGSYGSASTVPTFTVNSQGQLTAAGSSTISIPSSQVSGLAASATTNALNASNLNAGTLAAAYGGTGVSSTPANGQLLIGNGTNYTLAALIGGTGLSVTNSSGAISLSNTGVTSVSEGATGLAFSGSTGAVNLTGLLVPAYGGLGVASPTGYLYGNGSSAVTASTTIPGAAVSGNISGNASNITGTYAGTLTSSQVNAALGFTPVSSSAVATSTMLGLVKPDNATILNSSGYLTVAYGTVAGTAAQGNDSRITGALSATSAASTYLPLAGGSLSGGLSATSFQVTPSSGGASITLNDPAGTYQNGIYFSHGGTPIWQIGTLTNGNWFQYDVENGAFPFTVSSAGTVIVGESGQISISKTGSPSFSTRPTFNGATPWDSANLPNLNVTIDGTICTVAGSNCDVSTTVASLVPGSTAISGGTSGKIEYNNSGVLGEIATTGTGSVVESNSPTFTGVPLAPTPSLGTNTTQIATMAAISSHSPCVQINDYGGDPTGSNNNNTALSNAIAAATSSSAVCVSFGAGTYKFSANYSYTLPTTTAALTLEGQGPGVSTLYWPGGGGLTINYDGTNNPVTVQGISITTGTTNTGSGLLLYQTQTSIGNPAYTAPTNIINVYIGPTLSSTNYWQYALNVSSVSNVNVSFSTIFGSGTQGTGVLLQGTSTADAVIENFNSDTISFLNTGIDLGEYVQGVTVNQSNLTGHLYGVLCLNATGTDQLTISNSQFETTITNGGSIYLAQTPPNVSISNNLISGIVANYEGISINYGGFFTITGNIFSNSSSNTSGIYVSNSLNNYLGVATGNLFQNLTTGVNLTSTSKGVNVQANQYSQVGTNYVNSGTANSVGVATP